MFKRANIKTILIIFVALLAVVVISEIIDSKKGDRTFRKDLVQVSPDEITSIVIHPKRNNWKEIKLFKEGNTWKVSSEGKTSIAEENIASNMISELNKLKPESVVSTNKEKWNNFEVTDSTGTRVQLFSNQKIVADLYVGKYNYSQTSRSMTVYVRLAEDKEVYSVEGYGAMSFNRDYNSMRDKTIIKSNKDNWTKLTFSYPSDSSFILEKVENKWLINQQPVDSAAVAEYMNKIQNLTDHSITDEMPMALATHSLSIEGNSMLQKITIDGFDQGDAMYINSSENKEAYFKSKSLFEKIFPSKEKLIKK